MQPLSPMLRKALKHQEAGDFASAAQCFERILSATPKDSRAWFLGGKLLSQADRHTDAIGYYRNAVNLDPTNGEYFAELSQCLIETSAISEAVTTARRAVALGPQLAISHAVLGSALTITNQEREALRCADRALEIDEQCGLAHIVKGVCLKSAKEYQQAIDSLSRAVELMPNEVRAWRMLSQAYALAKLFAEAINAGKRAIELYPHDFSTYLYIAGAALNSGRYDVAIQAGELARKIDPTDWNVHGILGTSLYHAGRYFEAQEILVTGEKLAPSEPMFPHNLGAVALGTGDTDLVIKYCKKTRELKPDYNESFSNELFSRQYTADASLKLIYETSIEFEKTYAEPLRKSWREFARPKDKQKKLRIGLVGGDFHSHPVGFLTIGALERIDNKKFEFACYSNGPDADDATNTRFRKLSVLFTDIREMSDDAVAERIREDGVDILIDLSGHSSRNRLLILARKPAPIQATWVGHPGSTGLTAIDYLITDEFHLPPNCDQYLSEKHLRLPCPHITYEAFAPELVAENAPCIESGTVTFGSFNNPAKLNPRVIEIWSSILNSVAGSKLFLKFRAFDDRLVKERFLGLFAQHGVSEDRLIIEGWSSVREMLKLYGRVDIALDPFPFCGGMTTFSSLEMGVPVVTYQGETFACRQTASYYTHMGMSELTAHSLDEYVALAQSLARSPERIQEYRKTLQQRLFKSPLCDRDLLARQLEVAFRGMWNEWCGGGDCIAELMPQSAERNTAPQSLCVS